MQGQAAAADGEDRGCGVQHWSHAVVELREKVSQETQHFRPSLGHNFAGRNRQPFAFPRVMADAGGGLVGKANVGQLDVVQDAGDDAAHGSDADLVVVLQNSCWPSRTPTKKQTRIQR